MAEKEYIERDALCYQLEKQATIDGQPRAIKRAAKIVADFPAADVVERKTGKWILPNNKVAVSLNQWICSECNYLISGKHNYCPNCGADMREES